MKHLVFLSPALVLLLMPWQAWAHALGADWRIVGNKVVVEAYFSDDTPAQAADPLPAPSHPSSTNARPHRPSAEVNRWIPAKLSRDPPEYWVCGGWAIRGKGALTWEDSGCEDTI